MPLLWRRIAWFASFTIAVALVLWMRSTGYGWPATLGLAVIVWIVLPLVISQLCAAFVLRRMRRAPRGDLWAIIAVLLLLLGFLADRLVRVENQRYALAVGMCKVDPADPVKQWMCLDSAQTRTSWFWHLYYAATDHVPPVRLF